ncbi:IPYR-like protein [Mya arenaria]|uniref:inorganic diphosphatase n=1 Tax=Mya arenaria TaxID=6604 RepID=A0ABY7DF68_MYAAR|nr:IPYR-like protein [Mya arenaria]
MQRVTAVKRVFSWLSCNQYQYLTSPGHLPTINNCSSQRSFSFASRVMSYQAVERGRLNTTDYRVFITDGEGKPVSPFHDIPLYSNPETKECNMVVEIPRWTNHKMEICKEEPLNPIKQDVKKGKIRFVKNCFPHHGYIWNYGALPQTWEDVEHEEPSTGTKGDNDPLDVCEIGQKVHKRGNIDDVEKHMPGFIKATREWFTIYKIPDGKPSNKFAFNGEAKNRDFALRVLDETHGQWQKLVGDGVSNRGDLCCKNAAAVGPAESLPDDVDLWHYIPPSAL